MEAAKATEHLLQAMGAQAREATGLDRPRLDPLDGRLAARLAASDLEFLARARADVTVLAELTLALLAMHQPHESGVSGGQPATPPRRCRSCLGRWPCPTAGLILTVLGPQARAWSLSHPLTSGHALPA